MIRADVLRRISVGLTVLGFVAVALACAPGLLDSLMNATARWLPRWFTWGLTDAVTLPKKWVTWTFCPLIAGIALAAGVYRGPSPHRCRRMALLLAGFALWTALTNALGIHPQLGWEDALAEMAVLLMGTALCLALDAPSAERILAWTSLAALSVAVYSLMQHFHLDPLGWDPAHAEYGRTVATFGNPDFFSVWLAALLPVFFWRAGAARSPSFEAAWGAAAAVVAVACVFSYTRAAWLALLVETGLLAAWFRPWPGRAGLSAFAITGVLLGAAVAQSNHSTFSVAARISDTVHGDPSVAVRRTLWIEALRVSADHPLLGVGENAFSYAAMPHRDVEPPSLRARVGLSGDPHNAFLDVLVSSGVPGLLLLLVTIGYGGFLCWRADPSHQCVAVAATALCVGHAWVRFTLPSWWLAALLGVCAACLESDDDRLAVRTPALGRWRSLAAAGVVAVGLALAGVGAWKTDGLVQADLEANVANSLGQDALRVSGRESASLLRQSLDGYSEALRRSSGLRRAAMASGEAALLESLLARLDARDASAAAWAEALREQARDLRVISLRENPFDPYAWLALAHLLMQAASVNGSPSAAAQLRTRAIEAAQRGTGLDPYNAALQGSLAVLFAQARDFEAAERTFERSLELAPQQASVSIDHAQMLMEWGHTQDAVRILHALLDGTTDVGGLNPAQVARTQALLRKYDAATQAPWPWLENEPQHAAR